MSINKGDRTESRVEFDNIYHNIVDDWNLLNSINFGAKNDILENNRRFIKVMSEELFREILNLGTFIKIAYSTYPTTKAEFDLRRVNQDKAIGICFDILQKYQIIMKVLHIKNDKYTTEIKHIAREIKYLQGWKESDTNRFKF